MPARGEAAEVVRLVEGVRGRVRMQMELKACFDYGRIRPVIRRIDGADVAFAGPDSVWLRTPVETRDEGGVLRAEFSVTAGELVPFVLTWRPSHEPAPPPLDLMRALADTESYWTEWVYACSYSGEWPEAVIRSLITLKALTYAPTGGIVAAPTTSLPEQLGGVRNWDYRYCCATLRSRCSRSRAPATGTRLRPEPWLVRTVAGDATDVQIMYGVAGSGVSTEVELPWLSGYEGAKPVRIGNEATEQLQLDVYGQVVNSIHHARRTGLEDNGDAWAPRARSSTSSRRAGGSPTRGSGRPRRAPPLRQLEGDVLGRRRPCAPRRGGIRSPCSSRPLARPLRDGSRARSSRRGTTRIEARSRSPTAPQSSMPPPF